MLKYNFIPCIALMVSSVVFAEEMDYGVIGTAYDVNTQKLVYREAYTAKTINGEIRVDYFNPDGTKFAMKRLSFNGGSHQPEFLFEDFRDQEKIKIHVENEKLVMYYKSSSREQHKIIDNSVSMVIDAGFDSYIQTHWDVLLQGEPKKFEFTLPTRLSSVLLTIEKISPKESPVHNEEYHDVWVHFRLQPTSKWISLFADPIYLAYDKHRKHLMRFYGRSNLDDNSGHAQDVRIDYQYF